MNILLFGGTTEGRELVEACINSEHTIHVCVATEYGKSLLPMAPNIWVYENRLDAKQMCDFIEDHRIEMCIDATHPYATLVSDNARLASNTMDIPYIRIGRDEDTVSDDGTVVVDSVADAVEYLAGTQGSVLVTTGSKQLKEYTVLEDYTNRLYVRVLPSREAFEQAHELGFEGTNLICMQGPFTYEMNLAMLESLGVRYMVTKNSGKIGGFEAKLHAARAAGVTTIVVGRPEEQVDSISVEEALKTIGIAPCKTRPVIYLVGMGCGNIKQLSRQTIDVINGCDCLIGATRMLDIVKQVPGQTVFDAYKPDIICEYLSQNNFKQVAILFSGDIGFYSGASKIESALKLVDADIVRIPGMNSLIYLCDKLGISWADVHMDSCHGRDISVITLIKKYGKVALLTGGMRDIARVADTMSRYGYGDTTIVIGERLSYEDEQIVSYTASELDNLLNSKTNAPADLMIDKLSVMYIDGKKSYLIPRDDGDFIRGGIPMTKEDVRTLAISKLMLNECSVLWDVGAGTGSISVVASCTYGCKVYAIERKEEGIDLIRRNSLKWGADTVTTVAGMAPEILDTIDVKPTHVFIGGSSHRLYEIIDYIYELNPNTRFVVTAITKETTDKLKELPVYYPQFADRQMIRVDVSRLEGCDCASDFVPLNGIYICSFGGDKYE